MADHLSETDELSLEALQAQVGRELPEREARWLVSTDARTASPLPEDPSGREAGGSEEL